MGSGWFSARRSWTSALVAVLALALAAGACTSDPGSAAGPISTTPVATNEATTPPATTLDLLSSLEPLQIDSFSDQSQVEAAQDLLRAQQALQRALMEPVNPDLPEFVSRFTGDALQREQARIAGNRDEHKVFAAPSIFKIHVETLGTNDDGSVTAVACNTIGARFYRSDTGELLSDNFFSQRIEFFLVKTADRWLVSFEGRMDDGTDQVTECPPR